MYLVIKCLLLPQDCQCPLQYGPQSYSSLIFLRHGEGKGEPRRTTFILLKFQSFQSFTVRSARIAAHFPFCFHFPLGQTKLLLVEEGHWILKCIPLPHPKPGPKSPCSISPVQVSSNLNVNSLLSLGSSSCCCPSPPTPISSPFPPPE